MGMACAARIPEMMPEKTNRIVPPLEVRTMKPHPEVTAQAQQRARNCARQGPLQIRSQHNIPTGPYAPQPTLHASPHRRVLFT
jgi:hypothetical protein